MDIETRTLTIQRGGSLQTRLGVIASEGVSGRASGYIRERPSSKEVLTTIDVRLSNAGVDLLIPTNRSILLPCGQFIYFIEVVTGGNRLIKKGYINVEP